MKEVLHTLYIKSHDVHIFWEQILIENKVTEVENHYSNCREAVLVAE